VGRFCPARLPKCGLLFPGAEDQLNRGAALLADHDEKVRVSTIDLLAGRRAKASAAYAPARAYFSAGMALLEESDIGLIGLQPRALSFGHHAG
jgi:hypothetical protein